MAEVERIFLTHQGTQGILKVMKFDLGEIAVDAVKKDIK